ncbi:MAG: TIGR03086 family metal-binding protein [Nocardioidaceae bacterium]
MAENRVLQMMPAALDAFGVKVHRVDVGRWDSGTPCTAWTVRDLVNHVTAEQLWAPHLLRGETMEQVGDRYDGDVLGNEPLTAWDQAAADARRAWASLDGGLQAVHTSMGEIPVEDYAEQMHMDLVVHGWDLASGADIDTTMARDAVEHVLRYVEPRADELSGYGVFAAPVPTDSDDSADRLLAMLGRDPR